MQKILNKGKFVIFGIMIMICIPSKGVYAYENDVEAINIVKQKETENNFVVVIKQEGNYMYMRSMSRIYALSYETGSGIPSVKIAVKPLSLGGSGNSYYAWAIGSSGVFGSEINMAWDYTGAVMILENARIIYKNKDIYQFSNVSPYYLDESMDDPLLEYKNWFEFVQGEGISDNVISLQNYYEIKNYQYINIYRQDIDGEKKYYISCSNYDPNFRITPGQGAFEGVDIAHFDTEYILRLGFNNTVGHWVVDKYFNKMFNDDGSRKKYTIDINPAIENTPKMLFSTYNMEYNGNTYYDNVGTWPDWTYDYEFDQSVNDFTDFEIIKKVNTDDTYIIQWKHDVPDFRHGQYEVKVSAELNGVKKEYNVLTINDFMSDKPDQSSRFYEFDLSDLAKKIASKCFFDSHEAYVYPTAIYVRPIEYNISEHKVFYDNYYRNTVYIDNGQIVRSKMDVVKQENGEDIPVGEDTEYFEDIPEGNNWQETPEPGIEIIDDVGDALDYTLDIMNNVKNWLGQFPLLIGQLFTFLPPPITATLFLGITFVVIARIAGR